MRIGLIVDGQAEYRSLPFLLERLETPHTFVGTLFSNMHPHAPIPQIVRAMNGSVRVLAGRNADVIIVLLDREDRDDCPGQWASQVAQALNAGYGIHELLIFKVIIKNSCYENWLIADPTALEAMPRRFRISRADISKIVPNRADVVDAQAILKAAAQGNAYSKVEDARRIMALADPLRMAANSRSFRKLMREVEHPSYQRQSLLPAN